MDKDLLVEIFVPTGSGGNEGMIATGYPVAPGRILTAGHVLGSNPEPSVIKVRWYNQQGAAREWQSINNILWQGDEGEDGLDAAVLDCTFPENVTGFGVLSAQRARTEQRWESEGFARAGKKGKAREPVGLKGACYSVATNVKTFGLGVADWPDGKEQWKGASGGPVFVNGSIIGVIKSCPENFSGRRLNATAIWPLLEIKAFRKAVLRETIGYKKIQESLSKILGELQELRDALGDKLDIEHIGTNEDYSWSIAAALTNLPCYNAIAALDSLHKDYCVQASKRNADTIRKIVNMILPAIYSIEAVAEVIKCIDRGDVLLINPRIFNHTCAEIIMAGVDGRDTRFSEPSGKFNFLYGEYRLASIPEPGLDRQHTNFKSALERFVMEKFLSPEDWQDYKSYSRLSREQAIKKTCSRLNYLADDNNIRYYFIFRYQVEDSKQDNFLNVLGELKESFPALVFINLTKEEDVSIQMGKVFFILYDMYVRHNDTFKRKNGKE